jgi:hypothetical protein
MKFYSGKKQNFQSWDHSPQMPDYHDSRIIECRIKGNFAALHSADT